MKLDIRYSQMLYYSQIVEVSKETYNEKIIEYKKLYEELYVDEYESFDEFLDYTQTEFLESLGIYLNWDSLNIVDKQHIGDLYFLITFDSPEELIKEVEEK